jgi:PRC-barrel domain
VDTPTLQYFETAQVAGIPLKSITVRVANGRVLGRFRGLILDPFNHHLRYLVVRASGWFGKTTLVPAYSPRIDMAGRAIEIDANDNDLWTVHNFTLQKALTSGVCARAA